MIALLALSLLHAAAPDSGGPSVPLQRCQLAGSVARVEARCGTLEVEGARVGFAVLPAMSGRPLPDPVVLLAGGPGQAATDAFVDLLGQLGPLRARRDIVLFDPRGTGRSGGSACPELPLSARLSGDVDTQIAALMACRAGLAHDPKTMTTQTFAKDLEALRVALGAPQVNLVGVSYGTRLAITYDQLFPGKARLLVLDGTAPLDMAIGADQPDDALAALTALSERCARQKACSGDVNLVQRVQALKEKLTAQPVFVDARHPRTGAAVTVRVDAQLFMGSVFSFLYGEETTAALPAVIDQAERGDLQPLVSLALLFDDKVQGGVSMTMQASVLCAEDAPHIPPRPGPTLFPDGQADLQKLCAQWPHATLPRAQQKPSSTPTLFLSGAVDPVTPPRHAQRARSLHASNAHVVVPEAGHNVFLRGCVPGLVERFIASADVKAVDGSCVTSERALPAFVDLQGPAP